MLLNRTISTLDEELLIEISPCTSEEVEYFTEGDCWKLARELHDRRVGKVAVVVAESDAPESWCHMVVELPDGTYLDALGIQSQEQLLHRWNFVGSTVKSVEMDDPELWESLVADQRKDFSSQEQLMETADLLQEWIEEL